MRRRHAFTRPLGVVILTAVTLGACSSDGLEPDFTVAATDRTPPATDTRTRNPPTEIPTSGP